MRSSLALAAMLLVGSFTPAHAETQSWFGFSIGVGNAPPAPRVVYVQRPETYWVPGTAVYVVESSSDDMFLYGGSWYVMNDNYWYRARSYSGPFVAVDVRQVPRPILSLPSKHWKHHPHGGPPGQMKKKGGHR